MDERDGEAVHAGSRMLVDQLGALTGEAVELRGEVVHLEGDMVHPGTAAVEEPADRRVGLERAEELDPGRADAQEGGVDALVGQRLAMLQLGAEEPAVGLDGLVGSVTATPR